MHFLKPFLLLFSLFFILSFSGAAERKEPVAISDTLHTNYLSPANVPSPDSIINFGKLFLNTPYRYGSPGTSSFDCSGFTSYVYRNFGYNLKRSSAEQAEQFEPVQPEELKTGDLVYFSGRSRSKRVGHVGIVVSKNDNGTFDFIHAAVRKGVTISNSDEAYYSKRFVKANRVVGFDPFSVVRSAATDNISSNLNEEPIAPIVNNSNVQRIKKRIPAEYHRVKRGETLSSIAQKYGMSIAELKEKNRIKGSKLSLKQQLKVKDEENLMVIEPAKVLSENTKSELQAAVDAVAGLNEAYYELLKTGQKMVDGIPVLSPTCLIPFKAKAWLDLKERKLNGEQVDSKNIKKHKNDVFRLAQLITVNTRQVLSSEIAEDMKKFLSEIADETVDLKSLGIRGTHKQKIIDMLYLCYNLNDNT